MNKIKNHRGITLVALIITVIIMLILAGVSINIAMNGGLFGSTKEAVKQTKVAAYKEQIDDIRINLILEQISGGLTGKEYIDRYEEEIRKNSNFKDATIERKDENTIKVTTKEGYIFEITEEETKYIGEGEGGGSTVKPPEIKPTDLNKSNTEFIYDPEGWTNGKVKVTIKISEEIKGTLQYSTDNETWKEYIEETEIKIEENGAAIYARVINSVGEVGDIATGNVTNIDTDGPTINTDLNGTDSTETTIDLSIRVTDSTSGISKIKWYYKTENEDNYKPPVEKSYKEMNGKEAGETEAVTKETTLTDLTAGTTYNIYAIVYDVAGNFTRSPVGTETIEVTTTEEEPDTSIKPYDDVAKDTNGVLTANATYTSNGKTAVVPKGFKVVPGIGETTSINDGLVIQDKDGNEFVWIPVEVTEDDTETEIASFYRSEWANNARSTSLKDSTTYTEPYADGYEGEAEEYAEMVKSVYENKGFYIGRYEAGSTTQRTNKANGTTEMVVKKNQYPYNYVGWGASMSDYTSNVTANSKGQGKGVVLLSKEMYQDESVGVTSTLCYGVQWDAMLDFIKDKKNVTSSSGWGNYPPSSTKDSTLKNTGSSDTYSAKNIYDVAGNVWEWTMEADSSDKRVNRAGSYNTYSFKNFRLASARDLDEPTHISSTVGFRVALYIK